jgi:hypothetical protein
MLSKYGKRNLMIKKVWCLVLVCAVLCISSSSWAWKPAEGPLMTRWAKDVSPGKVHREYPRPQMVREDWQNLNGLWDYAITARDAGRHEEFDGEIMVPFPCESALSGVMKPVGKDKRLWYRRTFKVPRKWKGQRVLLHFGAVDWDTAVWVNGKEVGNHKGGYDPFTFDITDALKESGTQEIAVSVWDPTNDGTQPRGKQVNRPGGIWYTAVTGIWQTVWLEPVPETYIKGIKIVPDVDKGMVQVTIDTEGDMDGCNFNVAVQGGGLLRRTSGSIGLNKITIKVPNAKLWSPDSPFLYDLEVKLLKDDKTCDKVDGYFGMRKIEVKKDEAGINRLFLNDKVLFQYGPLDQGWWPDGLYTAPTDEALKYDIEVLKKLGCNMLRKHVKIEPDRLYYWCDKLGLMVWQDMPSGDKYIGGNDADIQRTPESAAQFEAEIKAMITTFYNHPSIIMWVPYNEGWGQWDTPRIVKMIKELDPTRLVNNASGWSDRKVGDVHDIHSYPGPACPPISDERAAVLGEFGGLGLPVKGHTWQDEKNWGYRSYETREQLTDAYVALLGKVRPLIGKGLSAAVYTQTTDVEIEVNGYMTYDRAMIKADAEKMAEAARKLYLPPPVIKTVVPTSQEQGIEWSYTTGTPDDGWEKSGFDDSSWKKGVGGFGTEGTPGSVVRTEWRGADIWLRRTFELEDKKFGQPHLNIHHDEDAEVYINGILAAKVSGYTTDYTTVPIDEKARRALKAGRNCLAVHCRQTQGGQYIDVGLADVVERSAK